MKKLNKFKKAFLVLTLILLSVCFISCELGEEFSYFGFEMQESQSKMVYPINLGLKVANKGYLENNNINVELFYGHFSNDENYEILGNHIVFLLSIFDDEGLEKECTIPLFQLDDFYKDEYRFNCEYTNEVIMDKQEFKYIEYTYSRYVTIPIEFLTENTGMIKIHIVSSELIDGVYENKPIPLNGNLIFFYVKLDGKIKFLSWEEYHLFDKSIYNLNIIDFVGLNDLPKNPDRVVFKTAQRLDDEIVTIEVDIPTEKVSYVMNILFSRSYTALPKNIMIDLINEYIKVYQGDKVWEFHISLIYSNNRWYEPTKADGLQNYLYSLLK